MVHDECAFVTAALHTCKWCIRFCVGAAERAKRRHLHPKVSSHITEMAAAGLSEDERILLSKLAALKAKQVSHMQDGCPAGPSL